MRCEYITGVRLECIAWSAFGVRCLECIGSALPGVHWECTAWSALGVRVQIFKWGWNALQVHHRSACECITGLRLECAAWSALGVRCLECVWSALPGVRLECAAWSAFGVRCLELRVEVHPWCISTWKQVSLTWEITKKERTTINAMTEILFTIKITIKNYNKNSIRFKQMLFQLDSATVQEGNVYMVMINSLVPGRESRKKSALIQVMACCHQATSHDLSLCWPIFLIMPYGVAKPQWDHLAVSDVDTTFLKRHRYVCFSFSGNRTIFGWDIGNSIFDLENSRSGSWPRSNPMVTFEP